MIASSAGFNRSFWQSSRGFAIAPPNAMTTPLRNRTIRPKPESQIAEKPASRPPFPAISITSSSQIRPHNQRFGCSSRATIYVADLDDTEIQFLKPLVTPREVVAFFEDRIREAGI